MKQGNTQEISTHDLALYRSLTRMQRALDGLLATRSLDELTPAEVELETQWQRELEPVLADLYWWPLRNGLSQAPESETELRRWLEAALGTGIAVAALLALLLRFLTRGVNVGGRMGLDLLGVGGSFHLTDPAYLTLLDDHADMLTTPGSDMSLIDTTINHLATGIPAARVADNPLTAIGLMIAGWAAYRSVNIAITEETRTVANGLTWTYGENGIEMQVFRTRGDDAVCPLCAPLEGRTMPVNNIPSDLELPVHVACRCSYSPVTDNWTPPAQIWRGG